ncbi:MAG: MaoC family dehydratase [Proteobacteria bacterium]|nr:MaoC family dehydratase [Pseudomonadota bacterium]
MSFFEELLVGDVVMTGRHTFTPESIKAFARRFDPQRFHMDEEEAARSHFGALCASGWHTAAAWMRLLVDARRAAEEAARARGEAVAASGPALGLRNLKWLRPVYAGETIDYRTEITALRVSGSKPRFGLMTTLTTGVNQDGATVISFESTTFVERRLPPAKAS